MYQAPQGRPQSCPPMGETVTETIAETPQARYHKSPQWYATRATGEFKQTLSKAIRDAARREERKTRALAAELNATETRGTWMTPSQYSNMRKLGHGALQARAKANGWKRRKGAGNRVPLYLVPSPAVVAKPAKVKPGTIVPVVLAPEPVRPSLWRRFLGWFGA